MTDEVVKEEEVKAEATPIDGPWAKIEFLSTDEGKGIRMIVSYDPLPSSYETIKDMPVCHVMMAQLAEVTLDFLESYTLKHADPINNTLN